MFKRFSAELKIIRIRTKAIIRQGGLFEYLRVLSHVPYFKLARYLWSTHRHYKQEKMIMGSRMLLDTARSHVEFNLLNWGCHEPLFTHVMLQEIKEGMTIVGIGANIGYYALLESRLVGKTGKVYAIEPAPDNIKWLKENIALNNYSNIETYQMAVGNKNGTAKLYLSESPNLHNLLGIEGKSGENNNYVDIIDVETVTLDEFLKNKRLPDIVRMDVEGYEYNIIKGMKKTLNENKKMMVFMEIHHDPMKQAGFNIEGMFETFYRAGFTPRYLIKRRLQFPWQNPYKETPDIQVIRDNLTLEKLMEDIEVIGGIMMVKDGS